MLPIIWEAVPHSHYGLERIPHLWSADPLLPWPVRILFSRTQSLRGSLKPCGCSLEMSRGCQVGETLSNQSDCHSSYPSKLLVISCCAVLTEGLLDFNRLKCMRSWWIGKSGFAVIFLYSRTRICFLRTLGGSIWDSTGNHSIGVDLMDPVIILIVWFRTVSILRMWGQFIQVDAQYSAAEKQVRVQKYARLEHQLPRSIQPACIGYYYGSLVSLPI